MIPDTTLLLADARAGRREAHDALWDRLYGELHRIARAHVERHPGATLQPTGLVHEAYLRLVGPAALGPADRAHFLSLAARAMRCVLVDRARARQAARRGGGARARSLDATGAPAPAADARADEVLALDEALERLATRSERLAQTVELHFFGGLTFDEVAAATGRSVPTVKRDWTRARAWLRHALAADP